MFEFWLFVHIVACVIAFGPTYTFPAIASMAQKQPRHSAFAAQLTELIEIRYTLPFALIAGASGVALILDASIPLFEIPWLYISVIIYVVAVAYSVLVQTPNTKKMVELAGKAAEAGPPPEGAAGGPPPEIAALGKKLQVGGMILGIATLVVFGLMIFQPDL